MSEQVRKKPARRKPPEPAAKASRYVAQVTKDTDFRLCGNTDFESFRARLARTAEPGLTPPPLAEAREIYDALFPLGLTRMAAGMGWIERSNETYRPGWREYYGPELHKLWAVKNPWPQQQTLGVWRRYRTYKEAALEWGPYVLGPTYEEFDTIGEFLHFYAPWTDGNNPELYGQRLVTEVNATPLLAEDGPPPPPPPPGPDSPYREVNVPGAGMVKLPKTVRVETILTPVGVHRPGRVVNMQGFTIHETANFGNGAGARMHSNWQDGCTQGHPNGDVGVSVYVETDRILIKIPFNENSIHSGDWRNNAHVSCEICVNADRNAAQTEETAKWLAAAILRKRGQNARDHLYPHTNGGHCPGIINRQGRWSQFERDVDAKIDLLNRDQGPAPGEQYVDAVPVPKTWDGVDWVRPEDGHVFTALSRVFKAKVKTAARVSADERSKKVRADLNPGEAFLCHYVTQGSDQEAWLVSQHGSRIAAKDCEPGLNFDLVAIRQEGMLQLAPLVLADPSAGLVAGEVPDDAPVLSKAEFMSRN